MNTEYIDFPMNKPPSINTSSPTMFKIKKYAAIDIGSNAMRLLIANIVEQDGKETQFNKNSLVRVPIRLGQDSFMIGEISNDNIERMVNAMNAFRLLMKVHKVEKYMAFATSAMREANNANEVIDIIKKKSDIKIEIIDGEKEAAIIASTDLHYLLKRLVLNNLNNSIQFEATYLLFVILSNHLFFLLK